MTPQPNGCLSCPNSTVLVLTATVDTGAFPACFAEKARRVRRLDAMYEAYFVFYCIWLCRFISIVGEVDEELSGTFWALEDDAAILLR